MSLAPSKTAVFERGEADHRVKLGEGSVEVALDVVLGDDGGDLGVVGLDLHVVHCGNVACAVGTKYVLEHSYFKLSIKAFKLNVIFGIRNFNGMHFCQTLIILSSIGWFCNFMHIFRFAFTGTFVQRTS